MFVQRQGDAYALHDLERDFAAEASHSSPLCSGRPGGRGGVVPGYDEAAVLVRAWPGPGPRGASGCAPRPGWRRRSCELGADKVAAFIGEPVQGAGGVIVPPDELLARDPAHLRPPRRPADRRRGHLRLRPHRPLVRLRALRHRARPGPSPRASPGLLAARRRDGRRPRGRGADRPGRRIQPRLHLFRPSGRLRRALANISAHRASESWSSACATTSARISRRASHARRAPAGRRRRRPAA